MRWPLDDTHLAPLAPCTSCPPLRAPKGGCTENSNKVQPKGKKRFAIPRKGQLIGHGQEADRGVAASHTAHPPPQPLPLPLPSPRSPSGPRAAPHLERRGRTAPRPTLRPAPPWATSLCSAHRNTRLAPLLSPSPRPPAAACFTPRGSDIHLGLLCCGRLLLCSVAVGGGRRRVRRLRRRGCRSGGRLVRAVRLGFGRRAVRLRLRLGRGDGLGRAALELGAPLRNRRRTRISAALRESRWRGAGSTRTCSQNLPARSVILSSSFRGMLGSAAIFFMTVRMWVVRQPSAARPIVLARARTHPCRSSNAGGTRSSCRRSSRSS